MKNHDFFNTALPIEERVKRLISLLTVEEKIGLLPAHQMAIPRLGINEWNVGTEVARGAVSHNEDEIATVFPQPIGMASMFNPKLMKKLGAIAVKELRYYQQKNGKGKTMLFGPTVDMCRDPRWGRTEECYGEDPYLTGVMSTAYCKGLVGDNEKVIGASPSLKHFCANNNEENRIASSSNIEPRTLHEYYYQAFKPALKSGYAKGVMTAYNELSGVPGMINPDLQKVLKDKWGMVYAVTDGGDFSQNLTAHHYSTSHAETIALAIKNGNDIMCDNDELVIIAGKEAYKRGLLSESDIDKAISNSLKARFMLGEFNSPAENPYYNIPKSEVDSEESRKLNRKAAYQCVTLLKNNGLLPLNCNKMRKVAVIGHSGGENFRDWYTGISSYNVTIADGLKKNFDVSYDCCYDEVALKNKNTGKYICVHDDCSVSVDAEKINEDCIFIKEDWGSEIAFRSKKNGLYLRDCEKYSASGTQLFQWFVDELLRPEIIDGYYIFRNRRDMLVIADDKTLKSTYRKQITEENMFSETIVKSGVETAAKLAKEADFVVVCVGNYPLLVARECYDRADLDLPKHQTEITKAAFAANPATIMTIVASYPYSITELNETLPAIIYTAHSGPEIGNAINATLIGENNPAARLPLTWYKSHRELPDIFDYDIIENDVTYLYYNRTPLYPFGYGLSYSKFEYSDFTAKEDGKKINFSLKVKNTSNADGDEVVQIYFRALSGRIKRPLRQLCGFKRINIKAGETVDVEITASKNDMRIYDVCSERNIFEKGDYYFFAGGNCLDNKVSTSLTLDGEIVAPRKIAEKSVKAINYDSKKCIAMKFSKVLEKHYISATHFTGTVSYTNCDFKDVHSLKVKASTMISAAKIRFAIDTPDNTVAEITVSPTADPNIFDEYEVKLKQKISGIHTLFIEISENICLLSFKGIK